MSETRYVQLWAEPADRRDRLCRAFYEDVYRDCFPETDEAEDPDVWLPLMGADPPYGKPRVFIICACQGAPDTQDERILGGIVFELYRRSGDWLATYIAVREAERRTGLGRTLFAEMVTCIAELAPVPGWQLYAEAENPLYQSGARRAAMYRRLAILSTFGLRRVPFDYVQPSLAPGKRQLTTLLFLCWPRDRIDGAAGLTPGRLASFLREFFAAHGQSDAPFLHGMTEQLKEMQRIEPELLDVPARYDHTLGTARTIVIRMTFFAHYRHHAGTTGGQDKDSESIPLDLLRVASRKQSAAGHELHLLSASLGSFYNDIVIPFASATSLPMILQCEPFREDPHPGTSQCPPPSVSIVFPEALLMEWEGEVRPVSFSSPDERKWIVEARLVDTIAIYESGYVAYSVSLIFGRNGGRRPIINAAAILALTAIAEPAGRMDGGEIGFAFGRDEPEPAHIFFHKRLKALNRSAEDKGFTAFSVLHAIGDRETGEAVRDGLLHMAFPDPTRPAGAATTKASISVEVIGAERHDLILSAAAEAAKREATANAFTLRLAGMSQNVLDFHEQDNSEINDSLAGGLRLGDDITFAQKSMAIRFSRSSRSFEQMWAVAGGEPYWMLVELVVGHNAKLLSDLNDDIREHQGQRGLSGMMRQMLFLDSDLGSPESQMAARKDLERIQTRRIRLTHYIPNLFRYPIEKSLYDMFAEARGLRIQRQYFTDLELTMERMFREVSQLKTALAEASEKTTGEKRNNLLIAIGVAQTTGVFAGFASVFAALATVGDDKYIEQFKTEVETETGLLSKDFGLPALSDQEWALVPTFGLVCASFAFIGAVILIFLLSRFGRRAVLAATATPVILALVIWAIAGPTARPVVDIVVPLSIAAVAFPIGLYLLWRSRE